MVQSRPRAHSSLAGLYLLASNGSPRAREKIRSMTIEEREVICPPALRGRSRRSFVLDGMTFEEQVERARNGAVGETVEAVGAEKTERGKKKVLASLAGVEKDILRHGKMTSASVAREAGIDGRKFRDYLRAMGLARQFASQRDAQRAVLAYREWEGKRRGSSGS